MNVIFNLKLLSEAAQINRCVVRLRRTWWHDSKGCYQRIDLRYMKRYCEGYNILEDDSSNIGFENVEANILNIAECEDGIYQVVTCNEKRDYESGCIEEYDYRLLPFTPSVKGTL